MKKALVLHPLLFAIFPVLAALAQNLDWVPFTDAARSLVLSLIGATSVLALVWLLTRDIRRAGLMTSLALLLFFSYGHLYGALKDLGLGTTIARHRYLIPATGAILILGLAWIQRSRSSLRPLTRFANFISVVLLVIPVITIAGYSIRSPSAPPPSVRNLSLPVGEEPPDIYYIIVDGYGRSDTLSQVYAFDNGPFLTFLEDQGFYVALNARANYSQTSLALASALNMEYADTLVGEHEQGREALWNLILDSEVRRQLEHLGYETVAFSTGLKGTEWRDADIYLSPGTLEGVTGANAFEAVLAQTTGIRAVSDGVVALPRVIPALSYPYEIHRTRLRFALDNLASLPVGERPRFVFAHLILPHPPFVFDAEGRALTPNAPFTLDFPSGGSEEDYLSGYRDQVMFLNAELIRTLTEILARSTVEPVIVLQADHGPDSTSGRQGYVQERMTILNAMLLPDTDDLWPDVTPVNTFRVIFNQLFGGDYERLEDRALYSEYESPFEFIDVTGSVVPP